MFLFCFSCRFHLRIVVPYPVALHLNFHQLRHIGHFLGYLTILSSWLYFVQTSCSMRGECLAANTENIQCFGTDLGYAQSSLALSGLDNQAEVRLGRI